jgi:hypothetical protein
MRRTLFIVLAAGAALILGFVSAMAARRRRSDAS